MDAVPQLEFHEVAADNWQDFDLLFESRGGPKACWCMVWRARPSGQLSGSGSIRKQSMEEIIKSGTPVGILGYLDGEPVAWCSIAPRPTYRRGLSGGAIDHGTSEAVWSLACFFIVRRLRGSGVGRQLLNAAIDHARTRGATSIEAYPVDPDSPSYLFMGFVPMFEKAGFQKIGRAGIRRHVVRLTC